MMRLINHRHVSSRESDRGAALVEFALVFPILVLLIFGIIEFGRGYATRTTLIAASREGVRAAALNSADPEATALNAAVNIDPSLITVEIVRSAGCGTDPSVPAPSIPDNSVKLTLLYDHSYEIPLFKSGTWSFAESAVMRCGG